MRRFDIRMANVTFKISGAPGLCRTWIQRPSIGRHINRERVCVSDSAHVLLADTDFSADQEADIHLLRPARIPGTRVKRPRQFSKQMQKERTTALFCRFVFGPEVLGFDLRCRTNIRTTGWLSKSVPDTELWFVRNHDSDTLPPE